MSRIANIFYALFLSLLLIVIGGGVTFVHCQRMQQTTIADLSQVPCCKCCKEKAQANKAKAALSQQPCMDYTRLHFSPQTFSNATHYSFLAPTFCLPPYLLTAEARPSKPLNSGSTSTNNSPHGPPRKYLRLITVLQI